MFQNAQTNSDDSVQCSASECWGALQKLRSNCPLIQCITNYVSMDIMANTLLAIGASPAMAHGELNGFVFVIIFIIKLILKFNSSAEEEVEEFVALASALLINIGTLSAPWVKSMHKAASKAQELGKVWVLDPVGVGATEIRTKIATDLVLSHKPTVIRGNPSEIMALAKGICKEVNLQISGNIHNTV